MGDVNMGDFDAFSGQSGSAEYQHQGGYQEPGYHGVGIKNVKVHQPKRYSGSRNIIELGNWIFSVDRYLTLTRIPESEQVLYASTLLDGEALLWFRSHYEARNYSFLRWQDVCQSLRDYFAPPNENRRLQDEWASLRQVGSVFDYVSKIQALAMQIEGLTDMQKLDKFIRGLKPKTRVEVELRDPRTPDEAYRLADRFDRIVYGYRDSFLPSMNYGKSHADNRGEPMQIDYMGVDPVETQRINVQAFIPKQRRQLSEKEIETLRATGGCFNCTKPGHIARDCPEKVSKPQKVKEWRQKKRSFKSGNWQRRH
jgi:Retrotransposon gag protein/Zinc knuckle